MWYDSRPTSAWIYIDVYPSVVLPHIFYLREDYMRVTVDKAIYTTPTQD